MAGMRKFLITILGVYFFILPLQSEEKLKTETVLMEDVMVFRLQSKSLFLSDLKNYSHQLKNFDCLYPQSQFFRLSQLSPSKIDKLLSLSLKDAKNEKSLLQTFRRSITLQIINNAQSLSVDRGFDKNLERRKCGVGRYLSWDNELKSLVQAEIFLLEMVANSQKQELESLSKSLDTAVDFEDFL